jgi:REP element-mobilizing transposase RayT
MRVLEHHWSETRAQITFSARPNVHPEFLAARAKGRLDHAARQCQQQLAFSRKVAIRSIGKNTREDVQSYIERQVAKEGFVDARFVAQLEALTHHDGAVDLSLPSETVRGRYWYNLHLVLVVAGRSPLRDTRILTQLRDATCKIATKKGHRIASLAIMPDHLHLALRPRSDETPLEVVFCYQNNLAWMLNLGRLWEEGYYVGTFGEYPMHSVRGN